MAAASGRRPPRATQAQVYESLGKRPRRSKHDHVELKVIHVEDVMAREALTIASTVACPRQLLVHARRVLDCWCTEKILRT